MPKSEGVDQILGSVLHPVSNFKDMFSPFEIGSLVALEHKEGQHRQAVQMDEAPEQELQHGILATGSGRPKDLYLLEFFEPDAAIKYNQHFRLRCRMQLRGRT
jgi:hypothetical protein